MGFKDLKYLALHFFGTEMNLMDITINNDKYIFSSERLGFRNWDNKDIAPTSVINADKQVMTFFPSLKSKSETAIFIQKMQRQFAEKGYCYYAVDCLSTGVFIGFIGISDATFISDITPCADIGWRLDKNYWNHGFATEGTLACMHLHHWD